MSLLLRSLLSSPSDLEQPNNEVPLSMSLVEGKYTDPVDGKPLRFVQTQDGFKIWTVGPSEVDSGGLSWADAGSSSYDLVAEFPLWDDE